MRTIFYPEDITDILHRQFRATFHLRLVLQVDHCFAFGTIRELWLEAMNFSLYRGNLHKVPDVPRRWPLSKPSMSLQVFQKALSKRHEALSRPKFDPSFRVSPGVDAISSKTTPYFLDREDEHEGSGETAIGKNADYMDVDIDNGHNIQLDNKEEFERKDEEESKARDRGKRKRDDSESFKMEVDGACDETEEESSRGRDKNPRIESDRDAGVADVMAIDKDEKRDEMDCDQEENRHVKPFNRSEATEKQVDLLEAEDFKGKLMVGDAGGAKAGPKITENSEAAEENCKDREREKLEAPRTPVAKDEECVKPTDRAVLRLDDCGNSSVPAPAELLCETRKAKRKAELEARLKQLQETKHQLVQMLKQVLTSEEESKRRGQGLLQFSGPYVHIGTNDTLTTGTPLEPRTGSDHRTPADLEEGELEYARTPSPPPLMPPSHGSHISLGPSPSMGVALGRQPNSSQHLNQLCAVANIVESNKGVIV